MSNFWIICDHRFHMHATLKRAEEEVERLRGKCPDKQFRIYRIKTSLHPGNAAGAIKELAAVLKYWMPYIEGHFDGVNEEHEKEIDKAKAVLTKIGVHYEKVS